MHKSQANPLVGRRHAFWRLYMGVWIVLAGASLAYLVLFVQNTDAQRHVIARIKTEFTNPGPAPVAERVPAAQPELTNKVRALNEELETLRRKLKQAQDTRPTDPATSASTPTNPETTDGTTRSVSTEPPTATSSLTTASIPRVATPDVTERTPQPFNPFGSNDSVVVTDDVRSDSKTVETKPAAAASQPEAPNTTPQTAAAPAPATVQTPPRRDLKGQNLSIRPLRPGQVPPLPVRQFGQTAAALPTTTEPRRATGTFVQPTVLNSDEAPIIQAQPAPSRAIARAPAPQPTPTSFGAPIIKRAPPPSALVLSSASSVTGLRASWLLLTTSHGNTLASLQPRYVTDPSTGTYRLLAGPLTSRAEADRLCSDLIGQGVRCGVSAYAGTPF